MTIDYSSPADNTITYPILGIRKRSGFRDTPVHVWNFGGFQTQMTRCCWLTYVQDLLTNKKETI